MSNSGSPLNPQNSAEGAIDSGVRPMTREQVIALMLSSRNVDEWNSNCDHVKDSFAVEVNGQKRHRYPDFWFDAIMKSGVYARTEAKW